jgi:hypothetical protein
VDSYGATSFAPVVPAAQPTHVSARNATAPMQDVALASTLMAGSSPVPPTMISGPRQSATPSPHYVVTPAPQPPPTPSPYAPPPPTMQSAPMLPSAPMSPYAPPPGALGYPPSYPMVMQPMMQPLQAQGTPGLAVAALVCGLLGWIPFWIGFILCLLAITFGGIVLSQTRPGQQGRGLAITGLVFGLVLLLPAACGL